MMWLSQSELFDRFYCRIDRIYCIGTNYNKNDQIAQLRDSHIILE